MVPIRIALMDLILVLCEIKYYYKLNTMLCKAVITLMKHARHIIYIVYHHHRSSLSNNKGITITCYTALIINVISLSMPTFYMKHFKF
uniref:Uncharacterized protein n=1 Tax=Pararge aegeria TaxID=116150 RepID=S4NWG1_9NEOP